MERAANQKMKSTGWIGNSWMGWRILSSGSHHYGETGQPKSIPRAPQKGF